MASRYRTADPQSMYKIRAKKVKILAQKAKDFNDLFRKSVCAAIMVRYQFVVWLLGICRY